MKRFALFLTAGWLLAACQTAPAPTAGFLQNYASLIERDDTIRASIRQRRDDVAAGAIETIYLEPAVLVGQAGTSLNDTERQAVLREVDRQICYKISERFSLASTFTGSARLRTGVTSINATGQVGSVVAALSNLLIPGPGTLRVPGTTGGLAAEVELVSAEGEQVAALAWARDANVVGTDAPSLSRIGDALQMARPLGNAVGDTIAAPNRDRREIADPDPCARYGPRAQPAGFLTRLLTGVYVPELSTGSTAEIDRSE